MYFWEHEELEGNSWVYVVYRRVRSDKVARCEHYDAAQKIVDALNAAPALEVLG
jgi:hypothetical protein